MANESGRKIAVGLGKESTRGTAVAPTYWLRQTDIDFIEKADKQLNESSLNVIDEFADADIMKDWAEGKISGYVGDRSFGLLLALAAGAAPSTAGNADPSGLVKDHTFTQAQTNESLTATVALKDAQRDERYAMGMLKSLDLEVQVGKWATYAAQFASQKPTASAGNTVAFTAENTFTPKHVTVKLATNVAGLAGASAIALSDLKLTIDRGVDPHFGLGSTSPDNIFAQKVSIKGDFTALFDSITHRDAFLNNTNQAMSITLQNTDVTIGTSARPKLVLTFPKVNFSDWGLNQNIDQMVEQTLGFQALYSLSDGYAWNAVLTNLVTSY